ncbi:MAG TPA: TM0106 family RecB-like putative nuclease [Gaiella sp.]|nr:TM0106 family RecB-like putative nuclease [Gaiella sp.]
MRLRDDGTLQLSPSDLSAHLACPHLTTLSLEVARGKLAQPHLDSPHRDLIFRKGNEHEHAYLARLAADGRSIVRIPTYDDDAFDADEARRLTEEAIRTGEAEVVYQPYLVDEDGRWRGFADFLERRPDGSYEPVDTKLARSAKPAHVLQLCFYAAQVARIQGAPVERVHVENGRGERETFRVAELEAYYRRARARFLGALASEAQTYGWPCDHCGICDFRLLCREQRVADDHLTLVAGLRRSHAETLIEAGVTTLEALGDLTTAGLPGLEEIRPETLEAIRQQAALQLRGRRSGTYLWELLPDGPERGFRLLPAPDEGDVWLDLEGHPFYETSRGLEYLFGYCYREASREVVYEALWGSDRDGEREIFERFVGWLVERRRRYPRMHVYHYAAYERTALTRLAGEHGTREDDVDAFLREEVLVDLYRIVKQSLRASLESYSIKAVEKLYGFERTADVSGGDESVVRFEEWLETGDAALLADVERYNEEDCRSTAALHEWLLSIRPPDVPWRLPPEERARSEEAIERDAERAALEAELLDGAGEGSPRRLLGNLVDYHQREARPQWWAWFRWPQLDDDELIRDRTAIGGLVRDGAPPQVEGQSHAYRMSFPPQEHKLSGEGFDPDTRARFRLRVDDDTGTVTLLRGTAREDEPLPRGLTPGGPFRDGVKREALQRFVRAYAAGEGGRYAAARAVLERLPPEALLGVDPVESALSLGESYLFVQGPPGSGKTWQGARMAIALMRAGKRVGVTSLSHKAIHNMLRAIQHEADQQGFTFRGAKRGSAEEGSDSLFETRCFVTSEDVDVCADPFYALVAGTTWALTRPAVDLHAAEHPLDVLMVDEAGQLALADVLAAATSARSLVLLGDPNQLPQVSQGSHPEGAERSVLQHLLGETVTVPPGRGVFLERTWRLRPELCAFTSDAYYEGRLAHAPETARRSLALGNGPVWLPVEHVGRSQSSVEEADAIAAAVDELLGSPFTDLDGMTRPLDERDLLVVAPYNAQVRMLRSRLPAAVPVGTVDKFQGQQAPVVLVSMASSSPDDAPRGIGFAFDRHRFNVATSRAQCCAVLVCSPRLLDADCRTVAQMRLVSAVCRFVELARKG